MTKRSLIRGLKPAFDNERLAVLEHPYSSHLWSTREAVELASTAGQEQNGPAFCATLKSCVQPCIAQPAPGVKDFSPTRSMRRREHYADALTQSTRPNTLGACAKRMQLDIED